jgi:hypothetical protein
MINTIFKEIRLYIYKQTELMTDAEQKVDTPRPSNDEVVVAVQTKQPPETLQTIFDEVHQPMADAHVLCKAVRPFVEIAISRNPTSVILPEVLAFIDEGITTETKEMNESTYRWCCTNGQMNAIVHYLNNSQYLLQDEPTIPTTPSRVQTQAEIIEDEAFMQELAYLAM